MGVRCVRKKVISKLQIYISYISLLRRRRRRCWFALGHLGLGHRGVDVGGVAAAAAGEGRTGVTTTGGQRRLLHIGAHR